MRSDQGKKHNKSAKQSLKELHARAKKRRLEGRKPTPNRIDNMVRSTQSNRVMREITQLSLPAETHYPMINKFLEL
jgi:hypothetical protein